jgi:hypothetical protein
MIISLQLSTRLYARLLVLYPEDLRRDYGSEMALAFADDLDTARRDAGLRGVIRVWRCALCEFLKFALPGRLSSPAVRVPFIALAFSVFSLSVELVLHYSTQAPLRFAIAAMLPTFGTVLTPLAVIWACRSRGVLSLGLSHAAVGEE